MYGRSATSMVGLYLLALVGVPIATFALFMLGYSVYAALRDHVTYYYYDFFTPYIVEPLYNLMCAVRDMALLFVILLLAGGWLGVTWAFFRLYQRDLTRVVEAAGSLMDPDAAPPDLPNVLAPAEAELRLARQDLINEFFDITRFNLSHIELDRRPTDLTRMVEQVVSEFGPMLAEQQLTCRTDLPPKLEYSCDPDKMARVFDNLLRNACHYSYPNTRIDIIARVVDGAAVLTFANAGRTIPPEKLDRIFEQFFRLDESRATRTGGAGLGLAIARQIVELHGGTITAESADEHIVFTLRLPLAPAKAAALPDAAAARKS